MSSFLACICCCFYSNNQAHTTARGSNRAADKAGKSKKKPKPSRIVSNYSKNQIFQMNKQDRNKGIPVYTCPICTLLFNKILACQECENNVCRNCLESYEKKYQTAAANMKCPFCNSEQSIFYDYQKDPRSYFDTTNKGGFLDSSERKKIDEELGVQKGSPLKKQSKQQGANKKNLQTIQEESRYIPTNQNLEQPLNRQVVVSRNSLQNSPSIQPRQEQRGEEHQQESFQQLQNRQQNRDLQQGNNNLQSLEHYEMRTHRQQPQQRERADQVNQNTV